MFHIRIKNAFPFKISYTNLLSCTYHKLIIYSRTKLFFPFQATLFSTTNQPASSDVKAPLKHIEISDNEAVNKKEENQDQQEHKEVPDFETEEEIPRWYSTLLSVIGAAFLGVVIYNRL